MMHLRGRKTLVVGLARTGLALAHFLAGQGARVTVTDAAAPEVLAEARREMDALGAALELGVPQPRQPQDYDLILVSPGVPPELPWLEAARRAGVPVWGELELASHFFTLPVLAVSGTNGKTTTTTLLGELLAAGGLKPLVGGNIGTAATTLLGRQSQGTHVVLEVSSFQLDTAPHFHPQAAALLNITPDHLDRYAGLAAYVASKAGLFRRQGPTDLAVLNYDDPYLRNLPLGPQRVRYFSATRNLEEGAWLDGDVLRVRLDPGRAADFSIQDILLAGRHNLENIMAALLLALDAGVDAASCRKVLASFQGLHHRQEWVATIRGVDYVDDSKGTNVGAVSSALASYDRPVILIAGGRDKDSDFSLLSSLIRERVKALVLMGETREHLARVWADLAPAHIVEDMAQAVEQARRLAEPGDVVLLSPACASFDMFRDYAHRGETFQHLVLEAAYAEKA
jgi:UDP-N-acetylmuramoylalanine--D-glutamate ligase